jgi:hypothetical protein
VKREFRGIGSLAKEEDELRWVQMNVWLWS